MDFHEASGDVAQTRYAYPEALHQYEEALHFCSIDGVDDLRLSEKIATTVFFSREPEGAQIWFERALAGYRRTRFNPTNAAVAGTLLLRLSRQYWLNAATISALPLITEAIQLSSLAASASFSARANMAMAHYLILLGRHNAAVPFFDKAGDFVHGERPETRAVGLAQRGILFAAKGDKDQAYASFEAAIDTAVDFPDGYQVTSVWDDYGIWAMALGDIQTAQACREKALFVARERHIAWRIAYLSLRYAHLLLELEQYDRARDLVLDALTYDITTPCVVILMAYVGSRLALALDEPALQQRCCHPMAMDYAFRSGEPGRIGPLASALIRMHMAKGEQREANALARKTLSALLHADLAWDVLLDVAELGLDREIERARDLLVTRCKLPSAATASAYLALFDARIEARKGQTVGAHRHARIAADRFATMGWLAQQRLAKSLLTDRTESEPSGSRQFKTLMGDVSSLTKREEQVADLALKGLTNRAIARELAITEHTVESHMTSIMNRLGIRSRHQLMDAIIRGNPG